MFNLVGRFQGASISAFIAQTDRSGQQFSCYETNALVILDQAGLQAFLLTVKCLVFITGLGLKRQKEPLVPQNKLDKLRHVLPYRSGFLLWILLFLPRFKESLLNKS